MNTLPCLLNHKFLHVIFNKSWIFPVLKRLLAVSSFHLVELFVHILPLIRKNNFIVDFDYMFFLIWRMRIYCRILLIVFFQRSLNGILRFKLSTIILLHANLWLDILNLDFSICDLVILLLKIQHFMAFFVASWTLTLDFPNFPSILRKRFFPFDNLFIYDLWMFLCFIS